ncbi:MAG: hypothetical protein HRU80_03065 [Ignavibacteriales bacterium]|nr:MAG: hypothetical protein HRU80_03065 [Ignavibacteriales bacterium]
MNRTFYRSAWLIKTLVAAQMLHIWGCYTVKTQIYDQKLQSLRNKQFESIVLTNGDSLFFGDNKASLVTLPKMLKGKTPFGKEIAVKLSDCNELMIKYSDVQTFSPENIGDAKEVHLKNGLLIRCDEEGFTYSPQDSAVRCLTSAGKSMPSP